MGFFSKDTTPNGIEEKLAAANRRIEALQEEARLIADCAKNDVMANVAHELRTPFNAIIGFTEMILDRQFGDLTPLQEEYLGDVLTSARNLFALINDILDLARVENVRLELEPSAVKLDDLIARCLALVKEKALKHGIKLSVETERIDDEIVADERKLKRIFFNLLAGALQSTPDGGQVRLKVEMTQEDVFISVEDTGSGIAKQDLDRIFRPLEQAEDPGPIPRRRIQPGLFLTQKLVELHGGRIWAESEGEGKGASLRFSIPRKQNIACFYPLQEVAHEGACILR
ncbi:MAG TPA: HAMP domain-containing sensor histidine kinase [Syntrophobacteraceae bacterium]|nr:HAMP domain-containing sensor histidine kinase [Syntrophobacteraceae bacterium]